MPDKQKTLDAELIFGALRREKQWKITAAFMGAVAVGAIGVAGYVIINLTPPPPVVVPYDPNTGLALPNAAVRAVSLGEEESVVQASVYRYVVDRETYNQLDNDVRINRAIKMSEGVALGSLRRHWNSASESYIPKQLGDKTQIEVNVTSISRVSSDRMQIRLHKTRVTPDGRTTGRFTIVLKYAFEANEEKTLAAVWENPLGFKVLEYNISADRLGG